MTLYDGDTFEHAGRKFRFNSKRDDMSDAPWENDDGRGPVSEWTSCNKAPGEWVLTRDRGSYRYYDAQAATRRAKADGWGLTPEDTARLAAKLGHAPTRNEIAAEAVRRDFEFLRSWCQDEWEYVGVIVTHIPEDGEDDSTSYYTQSLWGIESNAYDYLEEVAHELASEIVHEIETEAREAAHWAAADLVTLG